MAWFSYKQISVYKCRFATLLFIAACWPLNHVRLLCQGCFAPHRGMPLTGQTATWLLLVKPEWIIMCFPPLFTTISLVSYYFVVFFTCLMTTCLMIKFSSKFLISKILLFLSILFFDFHIKSGCFYQFWWFLLFGMTINTLWCIYSTQLNMQFTFDFFVLSASTLSKLADSVYSYVHL